MYDACPRRTCLRSWPPEDHPGIASTRLARAAGGGLTRRDQANFGKIAKSMDRTFALP
jgi:hypothetical protein